MNRPKVLLADDHRIVAEGLKSLLADDFEVVGLVEDGRSLITAARTLNPDVIVADVSMPYLNGIDAILLLRRQNPRVKIVILTMHQDPVYARRGLDAGASGFVLKHSASDELVFAIKAALRGHRFISLTLSGHVLNTKDTQNAEYGLTPRQRDPAASGQRTHS